MSLLINSYAYAVVASDVTPDAIGANYSPYNEYGFADTHSNIYFQIQGISTSITIKASMADSNARLYYFKKSTEPIAEASYNPLNYGWTSLSNNSTFSVSNGEWVVIAGYYVLNTFTEFVATLLNASDGDNQLTELNCTVDNS